MAGSTTPEGIVIPAGGDTFDYLGEQRRMAASQRTLVPVPDRAGGDAVASAMNTDGRPVSAANPLLAFNQATRNIEWKDGAGWSFASMFALFASTAFVGSSTGLLAGLQAGTIKPIIQCGTFVGTTDASGYIAIPYPVAFPNGVIMALVGNGDSAPDRNLLMSVATTPFTNSVTTLFAGATSGGAQKSNAQLRFNWVAIGW